MTRRTIIVGTGVIIGAVLLFSQPPTAQPAPPLMSVVVILTDDQRADTLSDLPLTMAMLAPEAVQFTRAFATTPLCSPARGSLLTGLYAHRHLVVCNATAATLFRDSGYDGLTLATWLKDGANYRTGLYGKYINGYSAIAPYQPAGWDEWHAFGAIGYTNYSLVQNGVTHTYVQQQAGDGLYSTTKLATLVQDFIRTTPPDRPFFAFYAPFAPHNPATPEFAADLTAHDADPLHRPPNYNELDVSDKPLWVKSLPRWDAAKRAEVDLFISKQRASLASVDRNIATRIIPTLQAENRWDTTVLILMGDNGMAWGAHRWKAKNCVYEECARVPLVVRLPGGTPGTADQVVANIDIAPTIAALAGVTPPYAVDGMSLLPILMGGSPAWRQDLLLEVYDGPGGDLNRFTALRTADEQVWVEYAGGAKEYYHLPTDPYQLENGASTLDPTIKADLRARLAALR